MRKIGVGIAFALMSVSVVGQDFLVGNEEVERNGMPMVARKIAGNMAGMEGVVTIYLVRLANGSYLYESSIQNEDAIEFNKRICAMYGDGVPLRPGKMVIGSDERNIPLHCESADSAEESPSDGRSSSYWMPEGSGITGR